MVEFEQTKVQEFIEIYRKENPNADMNGVLDQISESMTLKAAPKEVKKVIRDNFNPNQGQESFDFGNYNHRVLLGQKIIDELYK